MTDPYITLATAEEGSPEHLQAVADIQAMERANAKAQENVIKGTGRSGHAYASYTIVPADLKEPYERKSPDALKVGVASPDMRELVRIGDMETSREVAEAMRRDMNPMEWQHLTGLAYVSLTQNPQLVQDAKTKAAAKLAPIQEELDQVNAVDELARAEDDAARIAKDQELQNVPPSVLEQVLETHYGPDLTQGLTRQTVESGEVDLESLSKLGVAPEMVEETIAHYTEAAEKMLEPVGSCTAYSLNFLSEAEQKTMRQAIVARDLAKVQSLGMRARDRAAQMSYDDVSQFLTKEERLKVRLRQVNRQAVVDLPGVGTTSWANAVTMGLVSFR
jgi:hypothetical protein